MRILYISALPETMSGGPKYSVPKQIKAQSRYDEVTWINITPWKVDADIECHVCLDKKIYMDFIKNLEYDLAVFEDFYDIKFLHIAKQLRKKNIPYIIVPRGCMTSSAQKMKGLKKSIANKLFFEKFSKKALAIEFLTENEKIKSGNKWNEKYIVLPNGTELSDSIVDFKGFEEQLKAVFIGRLDVYHKGLDVFLEACANLKELILERKFILDLYGPSSKKTRDLIIKIITENGLQNNIFLHKEIHGKEKENILLNSHLFILTSRFEGLPMGLLEAEAYGLPTLVTDETNLGEEIQKSGAGLSSPFSLDLIQNNFATFLREDRVFYEKMSSSAIKLAKRYSWADIGKHSHKCYEELLLNREK